MPDPSTDEPWLNDAACRQAPNPDLWFSYDPADRTAALAICADCDVRTHCLAAALRRGETYGIWGGRTQEQLQDLRHALRKRGA